MYREAIKQLELWRCRANRKPLILRGARQVGKIWIMKKFGKQYYEKCAYISMDENERMKEVFREAFDIDRIIEMWEIEVGFKIAPVILNTIIMSGECRRLYRNLSRTEI